MLAKTDPYDRDTDGDGLPDDTDPMPRQGVRFLHTDQLGSTILATGATGAVLERVAYRPYGGTVAPSSGPTATPRFGFTGQRLEASIGIYDYRARFYDPALGRFLQPDPVVPDPGNPQSLNRYAYVLNNPVNRVDPSGNVPMLVVGGLIVAAGGLVNVGIDAVDGGDFSPGKSFTVGAASTLAGIATGLATANPLAGGAVGGAVGTLTEAAFDGKAPSAGNVVKSTALGAVGGKFGQKIGQGLTNALSGRIAAAAATGEVVEGVTEQATNATAGAVARTVASATGQRVTARSGAVLSRLSPRARDQLLTLAEEIDRRVFLVGSRARGVANADDFDIIVEGELTREIRRAVSRLAPRGARIINQAGFDLIDAPLNETLPFIEFLPR